MSVLARSLAAMVALWLAGGPAAEGQRVMLVHLPSAPAEAAQQQADAVNALAEVLSEALPGQPLEAQIFRRFADARDFLERDAGRVALLLSDASSAASAPAGFTPAYRFVRAGGETYRRVLVVRSDRDELARLRDLRGRSLAVVEAAGAAADVPFLEREVFEGELDPAAWFGPIELEADDFSATAAVLYGQTDAALVAEYNPLLARNLGQELKAVFSSPELSLPILSLRDAAFEPAERAALDRALADLGGDALGRRVLADLGIEGFRPLPRGGLAPRATPSEKRLAIAGPGGAEIALEVPRLPSPEDLTFALAVELPEIPVPVGDDGPR